MRFSTPFFAVALLLAHASGLFATDLRFIEDAALRAVHFIDAKEGWAVGDEGVVLHTIDGGRTWQPQASGTRASLRSVHFHDDNHGWAAGREELPGGRGSVGVLLATEDGGFTWKRLLANALPGINQLRFASKAVGFLLTDGCDQFPSGLYRTINAGREWEPVAGPRTTAWMCGAVLDEKNGVFGGAWSRLATLKDGRIIAAEDADTLAGRHIRGMHAVARRVLAVADGGLVLSSTSAGARWGFVDLKLPADLLACLDFSAIHAVKDHAWIVGRPGSFVLCSDDAGVTWQMRKTNQTMPLHAVHFADEKNGWAVGDAGTILATQDAGRTWQVQHQGGKRAATLHVHAQSAPLDTLTVLGGCDGNLCAALRVVAPDPASSAPGKAWEASRYAAATRQAGAMTGEMLWNFPLPQYLQNADKAMILAHWNRRHADKAEREMLRQLVLAIRTWRPSVVLGDAPDGKSPLQGLIAEALQTAIRCAADAKEFPEQLESLGLEAWQVSKVYGLCEPAGASVTQDNQSAKGTLDTTVAEHAAMVGRLLDDGYPQVPAQRHYRMLQSKLDKAGDTPHWLDGLALKEGEARRAMPARAEGDALAAKAIRERQHLLTLADNLGDAGRNFTSFMVAIEKMPEEQAALTAFGMGQRYLRKGQWHLAQEAFLVLVDRYPAHPLAADAYQWLLRVNSSGEARRRVELKHFTMLDNAPLLGMKLKDRGNPIQQVNAAETLDIRQWNRGCVEYSRRLAGFGTLHLTDPAVQFPLQAARRNLGEVAPTLQFFEKFKTFVPQGPWSEAAQAELWINLRSNTPPAKVARSRLTEMRPRLDGILDDACWNGVKPLVLDNAAGDSAKENPTEAMFAYDQEFLYIALKCRHPEGGQVAPVKDRARDADLDAFDRVSILLDIDRDYATYYRLEVDQRGGVREDCWGDANWNPRWFVSAKSHADHWCVEAAIPLSELTSQRIAMGSAWAFNVVRTLPGRGVQSWSQPADVQPRPEGMSLLIFQQEGAQKQVAPMPTAP
jgi:photosystem II stability/assembly factor-like uncharacterized protein